MSRQVPGNLGGSGRMEKAGGKGSASETGFPYQLSTAGDTLCVVLQLPGIREEMIRIDLEGKTLIISAARKEGQHRTVISLPWAARLRTKRFWDGVLELRFGKTR